MKRTSILISALLLLLTAGGCISGGNKESESEQLATAIAQTLAAIEASQPTQAPAQPTNTVAPLPTVTPVPTKTPWMAPTQTPQPCNWATFVKELPLDDVELTPNESFTKYWRFKNSGTCTWNSNYKVVFYSGDRMEADKSVNLANLTKPGEVLDITMNMKAPDEPGTYKGWFKLQDDDGKNFAQFWVQIKVVEPAFAVKDVTLSAQHSSISGPCPQTFQYQADITANGAGEISYYLEFSDGSTSAVKTLQFSKAGEQTITGSWELNASGDHWIKFYNDDPNHQWFGPLNLHLTCTP